MGRPSDYREEYCERILEFFGEELYVDETREVASQGEAVEITEKVANKLPTFQRFAIEIGTTHKTLLEWAKVHPEFRKAYDICKEVQWDFLVQHGLRGSYKAAFAKFLATNITDLRDKQEVEVKEASIRIDKQDEDL